MLLNGYASEKSHRTTDVSDDASEKETKKKKKKKREKVCLSYGMKRKYMYFFF